MMRLQGQGHAKMIAVMRDSFLTNCVKKEEMEDVWTHIEKIVKYQAEYAAYMGDRTTRISGIYLSPHIPEIPCPAPLSVSKKQ